MSASSHCADQPKSAFFSSSTHYIHIGDRRVRKGLIKAALAYGGAALMGFDAVASIGGHLLFPHVYESCELAISCGGKFGAAASGASAFFDSLIKAAFIEVAEAGADVAGAA